LNSPVTDRSVPVAVHFKFEWLTLSSWIRARRREFFTSIAFSDVRCWWKPPCELAGANRAAATEPQCDAASCQDGQRSIKGMATVRRNATPLLTMCARACISNSIRSTPHFYLSYSSSSSAGAVPFLNSVPYRSCTYCMQYGVLMLALYLIIYMFFSSAIYVSPLTTQVATPIPCSPCICRMKCNVNLCCWVTEASMRMEIGSLTAGR
jgi:hypothetical protein